MAMYEILFIHKEGDSISSAGFKERVLRMVIPEAAALKKEMGYYAVMIHRENAADDAPFEYVNSDAGPDAGKVLPRHSKTILKTKVKSGHPELFKEP